jgi:hypothetical protein
VVGISNAAGSNGLAVASTTGPASISAKIGSVGSNSVAVNVSNATLSALSVTPTTLSVPVESNAQFSASATFSDNSVRDVTSEVAWQSGAPGLAYIDDFDAVGRATAIAAGTATITADYGGVAPATATLTVTGSTLVSISVTPAAPSVVAGSTQQLAATGSYSDGTTEDLTGVVTWSSSSPTVADVDNSAAGHGVAYAKTAGTATVTATDPSSGVSGNTPLTATAP